MFGIIERFGRLRSDTAIDLHLPTPACRLRRPYGANIKRHGFAVGGYSGINRVWLCHTGNRQQIIPTAEAGGYLKDCGSATAGCAYFGTDRFLRTHEPCVPTP